MNYKLFLKFSLFVFVFCLVVNLNLNSANAEYRPDCCQFFADGGSKLSCYEVPPDTGTCNYEPAGSGGVYSYKLAHSCDSVSCNPLPPADPESPAEPGPTQGNAVPGPDHPAPTGSGPNQAEIRNPLGEGTTLETVINNIITGFLGIVGVLALIAFIYGGFTWMISYGEPAKIQKGKTMMLWAVAGLVMIFSAYAIITFIFSALGI